MKLLFLDDDIKRWEKFSRNTIGHNRYYVRTPMECVKSLANSILTKEYYDVIFLDYDMDEVGGTSENVIAFLEGNRMSFKNMKCIVHSLNEVFGPQLVVRLEKAGYKVVREPFAWDKEQFLEGLTNVRMV